MEELQSVLFYTIEKTIRVYRQFAQRQLKAAGLTITVDQWLAMSCLSNNPFITQKQLSVTIFKDTASVNRIFDILIRSGWVSKRNHPSDGRTHTLIITRKGKQLLKKAGTVVKGYRQTALHNIASKQLEQSEKTLQQIIANCKNN
jgi:MarR family transcriptional regulator, transcriptional regulator for hemolysin